MTFSGIFNIKKFGDTSMLWFLYLIIIYVIITLINSIIVVYEKKDETDQLPVAYGGIMVFTSSVWFLFLLGAIITTHLFKNTD